MLNQATTYTDLVSSFRWQLPEKYNIGVDVCDKWAQQEPNRLALIHIGQDGEPQEYSFGDLRRLSNQTANLLQARGVGKGDRVGILLPQAPETGYGHVAIYKLGAIAVPLFCLFEEEALAYRIADSGARAVITNSEGAAKLARIRHQLPQLHDIFNIDEASADCVDFHAERQLCSEHFLPVETRADDPALIIYTSGTTGQPKGALHGHRVLLGHLPGVEMSHNFLPHAGDRFWTPADWAWIGGLYDVLMPAWHHGITVVSHRFAKFEPEAAFKLIADLHIRNVFLPPTALKMMRTINHPEKRWNLQLRSIASGGEPLGSELLEWGKQCFGVGINEFYGQTECNMIVSNCTSIMPQQPGIMGRPVPGHDVAIVDDQGNTLATGELGNIAVKWPDPVMFIEYWNNAEATRNKFIGDWLLTGDTGMRCPQGSIRFVGRDDDLITCSGYRIGPGEIEDCLIKHPAVKMVGVVGMPDQKRTEIVKAFVVLNDGYKAGDALVKELQLHVKSRLAAHEYPRRVAFIDELPMTTTGKVIRRKLRELA
jgi:acetyl-CoA synthetase